VTIASIRIYYCPKDKEFERHLNGSLWGFAEWFECRLKPIREQLRGPEAKGVNIVNFMLYDDPARALRLDQWSHRMNSFEYGCVYDLESLRGRPPMENIEHLMQVTAEIAGRAPWPQVLAVGRALAVPLTDEERMSLAPYLQWPRTVGKLAKQLENWKIIGGPDAKQ
jgi:hypothetical protein